MIPTLYIYAGIGIVIGVSVVGAAAMLLLGEVARNGRFAARLMLVTKGADDLTAPAKLEGSPVLRLISRFGMVVARSGILSGKTLAEMAGTLESAGFRGGRGLGLFIGAKILLMVLLPIATVFVLRDKWHGTMFTVLKIAAPALLGLLAPETIANRIRTRHLNAVDAGVPDALDMLVICADAGLALEAGLARVSRELTGLNAALGMELTQTSRELQIGSDMRRAMESLGERTGLVTLKRLSTTLAQSLQYGTPLTQALRSLSAELRQEQLVRFEERAGRLPTLMTIPMILFILPCVFLIVAGPAMINVLATMRHMK
jgi:tight adherence protein C